jgi:glycosyltransferase involved in cell wall biosynthesis
MIIGIDASNLRAKGGLTHLKGLLNAADPPESGIDEVIVWASEGTLEHLPDRAWLTRAHEPALDGHLARRLAWQRYTLQQLADQHCDLLFVPGGNYTGSFRPYVTMSRNLLPFSPEERARYGLTWNRLRFILLERSQTRTFRRADGMIFLTRSARECVEERTGPLSGDVEIIPHGVSSSFDCEPRPQKPLSEYSRERPFRWLYVSSIDPYKHQWNVVRAAGRLRRAGMPIRLDLIGPPRPPAKLAMDRLDEALDDVDPGGAFIEHHGFVPHDELAERYHESDAFVFASSCENMPNTLLEAMGAGLPIASSDFPPMPEVLGQSNGVFFDPTDSTSIADAMSALAREPKLRETSARGAYKRAGEFTWQRCAENTFGFLASTALAHERS